MSQRDFTEDVSEVLADEQAWIARRREAAGVGPGEGLLGLSLSGGGIRSAVFNLGVLQGLESLGLLKRVDVLSTVSGGGYIGATLTWLRHRLGSSHDQAFYAPLSGDEGHVLDWLRNHGKYLISQPGLSIWTVLATTIAVVLLNLLVLLPPMLLLVALAARDWLPLSFPAFLLLNDADPLIGHDGFVVALYLSAAAGAAFLLMIVVFAGITATPPGRAGRGLTGLRRFMGNLLLAAVALFAVGMVPIFHSLDSLAVRFVDTELAAAVTRNLTYLLPMLAGGLTLLRARRAAGSGAAIGLGLFLYGCLALTYHLVDRFDLLWDPVFNTFLLLSLTLAVFCDVNLNSMHHFYRGRLAHAFLPPTRAGEANGSADRQAMAFRLAEITADSGGPLHLINTTMNTTTSPSVKLQGRGGDNFVLSPLYCGARSTGYRRTESYLAGALELSTALTISGAAVDPNTSRTRSRPLAFLMALLNIRLGYWTNHPQESGGRPLAAWLRFITREMLGVALSEKHRHIHLSDGAHFDNLGLYELLRRRCRYIIATDVGADPRLTLAELGKAIERARVDFRAQVELNVDALYDELDKSLADRSYALGSVIYADGTVGQLLYIRPMMCRGMSADLYAYWRDHPTFPNDPTSDQFYDEAQFEAYRELGLQTVSRLGTGPQTVLQQLFEAEDSPDLGEAELPEDLRD